MQEYTVVSSKSKRQPPLCLLLLLSFLYLFHSQCQLIECTFAASAAGQTLAGSTAIGMATSSRSSYLMDLSRRSNLPVNSHARSAQNAAFHSLSSSSALSISSTVLDSGAASYHVPNEIYDDAAELTDIALTQDMAPPECYSNLYSKFRSVSQKFESKLSRPSNGIQTGIAVDGEKGDKDKDKDKKSVDANQLFRDSLTKASRDLVVEECENSDDSINDGQSMNNGWQSGLDWQNSRGNSDFVYKTLKKAVENMDDFLDTVGHINGIYDDVKTSIFDDDDVDDYNEIMSADAPHKNALITKHKALKLAEKLKDRAIKYAITTIKIKIKSKLQKAAIQEVGSILTNHFDYPGNPLTYLEPMLMVLNSNSIELASNLLTNLPFRGALALINQINPMPFMKCKPKDKDPEPYC